ncbi:MAG TPA: DUF2232 domain-containing protein [Gemmatimonadaceae bacterium]|nr:DUF2232 domain-containing protein [Gemmatimonadaceae bacterium]
MGATAAPATAPQERGWPRVLLALAAFLLLPGMPFLSAFVPVRETVMLVFPAMAACALVGWWRGGRFALALVWTAGTVWLFRSVLAAVPGAYLTLVGGWAVLVAATFGGMSLVARETRFFPRALAAVALATVVGLVIVARRPGGGEALTRTLAAQLDARNATAMALARNAVRDQPAALREALARTVPSGQVVQELEHAAGQAARATLAVFPAVVALQSLAALALAWGLYHRLSRARVGAPLSPLKEFRFNDQLVWGLIVAIVAAFLDTLEGFAAVGRNLLVFFAALYALRGYGVLAWYLSPRRLVLVLAAVAVLLFLPLLNTLAALALMALTVAAFGLGLSDTWNDWRRLARGTP